MIIIFDRRPLPFIFRFNFGYLSVGRDEGEEEEEHIYPGHKAKYFRALAVERVVDDVCDVVAN